MGGSNRASERSKGGVRVEENKGGRETSRGGTLRRTLLDILVLQMKNSELVYNLFL